MNWFKHDTASLSDAKIERLMLDFGIEGYGVYFAVVELISKDLSMSHPSYELEHDSILLAHKFKIDTLRIEKIMKRCVELGLFCITDKGRIACPKISKRLNDHYIRNPQIKQIGVESTLPQRSDDVEPTSQRRKEEIREEKKREEEEGEANVVFKGSAFRVTNTEHTANLVLHPNLDLKREYRRMDNWLCGLDDVKRPKSMKKFIGDWLDREEEKAGKPKRSLDERLASGKDKSKEWRDVCLKKRS